MCVCVGVGVCGGLLSIGDLRVGGASPTEVLDQLRIRIGFTYSPIREMLYQLIGSVVA